MYLINIKHSFSWLNFNGGDRGEIFQEGKHIRMRRYPKTPASE